MKQDQRCPWAQKDSQEKDYHDHEWGRPIYQDQLLFEFICLEGAQAGLSWKTILHKRDTYRKAFDNFDIKKLAGYDASRVDYLIENYGYIENGIVKNRRKIASVFSNAKATLLLQQEYGSFSKAIWQVVNHQPIQNHWQSQSEVPAITEQSIKMSQFLKKRGFKFVGETICYAFMQATGMVNDHLISCPWHKECKNLSI